MFNPEENIKALKEAVKLSPDNIILKKHLAETLVLYGHYEEAEQTFREALQLNPNDKSLKLSLANCFYKQAKNTYALLLVEEMLKEPNTEPKVYVLYAKLLFASGSVDKAVDFYKKAISQNADCVDIDFSEKLGIKNNYSANNKQNNNEVIDGKVRMAGGFGAENEQKTFNQDLERPEISFKNVGGMNDLKEEIEMKIIHPLKFPDMYKAYGKSAGGGILMYGPPGCGKTYIARATAGEINASFMSIGINDILDMWIGSSEKNIHEVFEEARRNKPCVLFFDEVDALAASRTDMRQSSTRHVINQFLTELDGVKSSNDGILILAATNAPWHLDSAFKRPGRFDRLIFVPPPDETARTNILRIMLAGKPINEIDYDLISSKVQNFSGADLKSLIDLTVEEKLKEAMKKGKPTAIETKDILNIIPKVKPSTKEWFATARNYIMYANQGGTYDDVKKFLNL